MKKLSVVLAAVISLSVAFTGCKTNEPGLQGKWDIDAKVENVATYNAIVDSVCAYVQEDGPNTLVAKVKYENGSFKMKLPAIASKDLSRIMDDEEIPAGLTISDKTAKIGALSIEAEKSGQSVGYFMLANVDITSKDFAKKNGMKAVLYVYADKNVKMTGTVTNTYEENGETKTYKETFNISLKAGWNTMSTNILSEYESEHATITSLQGYKWYFIPSKTDNAMLPKANIFRK